MHIIRSTITPAPSVMSTAFQATDKLGLTLGLYSVFPLSGNVHGEKDRPEYAEDSDDSWENS